MLNGSNSLLSCKPLFVFTGPTWDVEVLCCCHWEGERRQGERATPFSNFWQPIIGQAETLLSLIFSWLVFQFQFDDWLFWHTFKFLCIFSYYQLFTMYPDFLIFSIWYFSVGDCRVTDRSCSFMSGYFDTTPGLGLTQAIVKFVNVFRDGFFIGYILYMKLQNK